MTETITIPGYTIASRLGQGGMASVFLAVQLSFEREVALKVMSPVLNADPSFAARFKREARIVAQLRHASIVPVFEVGEHESCHYLSMEYLSGGDLKRRILDGERGVNLALNVCTALSAALDVAHGKGFVHRDIKPENILFREDGTPVLTDFGIARALDGGQSMTLVGMLVGTPDYMSPEQVKGLQLDGRSDLYSLGIVFYEILTGTVPFKADSTLSVALKQVGEPLPPLPPEYAAYQEFLDCLTAKNPEERFASGAEVIRALRVIGNGRVVRTRTSVQSLAVAEVADAQARATATRPSVSETDPTLLRLPAAMEEQSETTSATRPPASEPARSSPEPPAPASQRPARGSPASAVGQLAKRIAKNIQPLSMMAAALGSLAVGLTLIIGGLHRGSHPSPSTGANRVAQAATATRPDAGRQQPATSGESPQPALAGVPPQNAIARAAASVDQPVVPQAQSAVRPGPAPQTPSSQTQTSNATTSEIQALQTPTPTSAVQEPIADNAAATPPADAPQAQSEEAARRKRLAESRRQRKAEAAQLVAQQAAELRAAQMQAQIQVLLAAAKNEYAAGALWQPSGANAADSYREVLKMQPEHAEALAGAQRVANVLAAEAVQTESVGDIYTAQLLIDQIQSLQPSHPKLAELQARLEQLQTKPAVLDSRDRSRLERAAKFIARAEEDLGRTPLDFKAADDAADQYDKALSAAPTAPGLPSLKERLIAAYATATQTEMSNHQPKQALKLINSAHKRNWSSDELNQLESTLKTGAAAPAPSKANPQ
jgi:serine/threonine-protein kinase PpkA